MGRGFYTSKSFNLLTAACIFFFTLKTKQASLKSAPNCGPQAPFYLSGAHTLQQQEPPCPSLVSMPHLVSHQPWLYEAHQDDGSHFLIGQKANAFLFIYFCTA